MSTVAHCILRALASFGIVIASLASSDAQVSRPPALPPGEVVEGETGQRIDARARELAESGYAGIILAVKHGRVVFHKAYGLADREKQIPNTLDTLYDLGSITKQFTAAAIMKLHEQGKLSLDDPMAKYIAGTPVDKQAITIHHLLAHSSGMPDTFAADWDRVTRAEFLRDAMNAKLLFTPGEREEYSNAGYTLLAIVIEEISKRPYEEFVRDELFRPAGMMHTGYELPDWSGRTAATAYSANGRAVPPGILEARRGDRAYWTVIGNGEMLSTTADMYRWFRAMQGTTVLSDSSKRLMFPSGPAREARRYRGYGGLLIERPGGCDFAVMNGGNGFYSNEFRRYPAADAMLYVASTTRGMSVRELMPDFERLLNPCDLAETALPAPPGPTAAPAARAGGQDLRTPPPDSPRVRRVNELIALINAGSREDTARYVREQFDPGLLKTRAVEQVVTQLLAMREKLGEVQLASLVVELPDVMVTLQSTKDARLTVALTLAVGSQPPNLIRRFDVDPF